MVRFIWPRSACCSIATGADVSCSLGLTQYSAGSTVSGRSTDFTKLFDVVWPRVSLAQLFRHAGYCRSDWALPGTLNDGGPLRDSSEGPHAGIRLWIEELFSFSTSKCLLDVLMGHRVFKFIETVKNFAFFKVQKYK